MVSSIGPPKFAIYLRFLLIYPIDLVCLDFAVNEGGGVNIIGGALLHY